MVYIYHPFSEKETKDEMSGQGIQFGLEHKSNINNPMQYRFYKCDSLSVTVDDLY
ncbi:MAG: hypothetical protein ACYDG2_19455 [Ruminiclostridium sp.]